MAQSEQRHGKLMRVGILQQSKSTNHWSTGRNDATSNYLTTNYNTGIIPDPTVNTNDFNWASQAGLYPTYGKSYSESTSGLHRFPFEGTVTKALLAHHLVAAFQRLSEGATTPFSKYFVPVAEPLDFAQNEGFLYTIACDNIQGTDGFLLYNALLENLTLSIDRTATGNDMLMKMSGNWVGNEVAKEQNLSGTWVAQPTTGYYGDEDDNFIVNPSLAGASIDSSLYWFAFEMNIANTIGYIPTTGGKPANYNMTQEVTYNIYLPYDDQTYESFGAYIDGDKVGLSAGIGNATSDGDLVFAASNSRFTANPFEYRDEYHAIRLQFKEYRDNSADWDPGSQDGLVKMADAIDGGF